MHRDEVRVGQRVSYRGKVYEVDSVSLLAGVHAPEWYGDTYADGWECLLWPVDGYGAPVRVRDPGELEAVEGESDD